MKNLASGITISRIVASILLTITSVFSPSFFLLYGYCGLSDMIDGIIARKTGSVSRLGAVLDSIADMVFLLAAAVKILPVIKLESWLWIWINIIFFIKIINFISGFICCKRPVLLHTAANKVTGFLLFLAPIGLMWNLEISVIALCTVATFAAVQEGHFIRTGRLEGEV